MKYPALDPKYNLKSRSELIDYDYIDKLSDKEKEFLNNFTEEFIGANMNHKGKKLHKKKDQIKDCYNRNNARNRDILTRAKASGKFHYMNDIFNSEEELDAKLKEMNNFDDSSDKEEL